MDTFIPLTILSCMLREKYIRKAYLTSVAFVLGLAITALVLELLPEAEAKIVVVPTLVLIIALSSFELLSWNKRRFATTESEK
jgi:hypothetical protein